MFRHLKFFAVCMWLVLAGAGACASTQLTSSWKDQSYKQGQLKKVLVVGVSREEGTRRLYEEALVNALGRAGTAAASSAQVLPPGVNTDQAKLREAVVQGGYDSALVTHVVRIDQKVSYSSGGPTVAYGGGFYGYYPHVYGYVHEPGYYESYNVFALETNVYTVADGKLVWSVRSETTEPPNIDKAFQELSTLIVEQLQRDGLVPALATK